MRKEVILHLSEEEIILLAGILGYCSGDVLTEAYMELLEHLNLKQVTSTDSVATAIAIKDNGYYINEDDLLHEVLKIRK